jgi:hypothetical protein
MSGAVKKEHTKCQKLVSLVEETKGCEREAYCSHCGERKSRVTSQVSHGLEPVISLDHLPQKWTEAKQSDPSN